MKKIIFCVAAVAIFATAAVLGVKASHTAFNGAEALFYANVNALMAAEVTGNSCWDTITAAEGQKVLYCSNCIWVNGKPSKFASKGSCKGARML